MQHLLAHGIRVQVKTPVMTLNGAAAKEVHQMAAMMNMPCQYDLTITPKTDGATGPLQYQLQRQQIVDVLRQAPFDEVFAGPFDGAGPQPCAAGRHYCAVGPTGDVMPCIMMPTVLGNIRDNAFADIWRTTPLLDQLRGLTFESLTTCRSCDVKGACSRCPGLAMQRGQGVDGCDLAAREVAKAKVAARRLPVIQ
jgi:radical SAM protein with 4Fe4S-binding SPASM domain